MAEAQNTSLVALRDAREHAIKVLGQRFAEDALSLEDYERRVEVAQAAASVEELDILVADLEVEAKSTALAPTTTVAMIPAETAPTRGSVLAVLGSASRKGTWTAPRELKAIAVLGETELDFRGARMAPGINVVRAVAVLGEVRIVVPPGLRVDAQGSIESELDDEPVPAGVSEHAASLSIEGVAVLGEIKVTTRLPGESRRAARKRRKRERRQRKGLGRAE
jgi:hypothetical protein